MTKNNFVVEVTFKDIFEKKHKISFAKIFTSVHMKLWLLNADQNFKMKSVIAPFWKLRLWT